METCIEKMEAISSMRYAENLDIANIIHNNMVNELTKGQVSPISEAVFKMPIQINGATLNPFNPISIAIALDASFVAHLFAGYIGESRKIFKKEIIILFFFLRN